MLQDKTQHIVVLFYGFGRILLADFIDVFLYFSGLNGLNFSLAEIGNQMPRDRSKAGSDEQQAIENYAALRRLVIGVLDNIQNSDELQACITALGWKEKGESLL